METPKGCEEHQPKYKQNAWQLYTIAELGQWVHLFMKRAEHRTDLAKREKDLIDAQNYLNMIQEQLNELKKLDVTTFLEQMCDRIAFELREQNHTVEVFNGPHARSKQLSIGIKVDDMSMSRSRFATEFIEPAGVAFAKAIVADQVKHLYVDRESGIEVNKYGIPIQLEDLGDGSFKFTILYS